MICLCFSFFAFYLAWNEVQISPHSVLVLLWLKAMITFLRDIFNIGSRSVFEGIRVNAQHHLRVLTGSVNHFVVSRRVTHIHVGEVDFAWNPLCTPHTNASSSHFPRVPMPLNQSGPFRSTSHRTDAHYFPPEQNANDNVHQTIRWKCDYRLRVYPTA